MRPRDRKLHALVLSDLTPKDDPLLRIFPRTLDEEATVTDALGGDQDAFGVHPVEDVAKSLAFFTDQILGRHLEVVNEDFVRPVVHHGPNRANVDCTRSRRSQIDEKRRETEGLLLALARGRG